jgi:hypothetical protein
MPRLKNILNDKSRPTQVVMTEGTVVYKVPLGDEEDKIGHFIESEKVGKVLVFRFATKKDDAPALRIEHKPEFFVSFD